MGELMAPVLYRIWGGVVGLMATLQKPSDTSLALALGIV